MALYEKYLRLKIDRSVIGLDNTGERYTYFCTPKGASVIGWAGVEGIHYCFIRGFGDKVFAVSPSNLPGEQVHILADSFEDFLRLLLACGTLDAMEQAHILDIEKQEMNVERLKADEYEYPKHFSIMSYTLEPELSPREFSIRDCVQNDKPIRKQSGEKSNACSVGIIGGADGPTAIIVSKKKEAKVHSACSALHFEPVDDVEWKMIYMVKMCGDISVELIG